MTEDSVLSIAQQTVLTILTVAAPVLIVGLLVGLIFSIFQTMTSIQEPTLAFVPKIVAVMFALLIFGPFMLATMMNFISNLYTEIPVLVIPEL